MNWLKNLIETIRMNYRRIRKNRNNKDKFIYK